jgi:catechol-2,3-dioxygenase
MPIQRLNHAVLYVRNVETSVAFYCDVLGFTVAMGFPGAAFLRTAESHNDHDLGLFEIGEAAGATQAGRSTVGLYHLAWEVDSLAELKRIEGALLQAGALVGASDHGTTKALYAHDPDGLEFEVCWLVPGDRIVAGDAKPLLRPAPLNIDREIEFFGANVKGGTGLPVPAGV